MDISFAWVTIAENATNIVRIHALKGQMPLR